MKDITIQGLTHRQVAIMDLLWTLDDMPAVAKFIAALPTARDQCDAESLVSIAVQDSYELSGALDEYYEATQAIISRCRS